MVKKVFIPRKGDIIKLCFTPNAGHEQAGWRPGLVISNGTFNNATGFALVCPITSKDRGYPFHVKLPGTSELKGVVMVEQVKSLDYRKRKAVLVSKIPVATLARVMSIHGAIIQDD